MEEQLRFMDQITATAIDLAFRFGPKLLVAVLVLIAGVVAGRWAARGLERALGRFHLEPPVVALMRRATYVAVLGLFVIMALQNLGVELLPLIAGLGIAGAGIALAMQGVLGNLVAGLTIIFSRPFRVGDYISIVSEEGEVLEIQLFSTTLGHADLSRVVIPNRKIVGEILHNYGKIRQLAIEVTVSGAADVAAALRLAEAAMRRNARVLKEPAPFAGVAKLTEAGIVVGARAWTKLADFGPAASELRQAIVETFREGNIAAPVPRRDIQVLSSTAYVGRKEAAGAAQLGSD
jgi:small conductance mechanosensitive channel